MNHESISWLLELSTGGRDEMHRVESNMTPERGTTPARSSEFGCKLITCKIGNRCNRTPPTNLVRVVSVLQCPKHLPLNGNPD